MSEITTSRTETSSRLRRPVAALPPAASPRVDSSTAATAPDAFQAHTSRYAYGGNTRAPAARSVRADFNATRQRIARLEPELAGAERELARLERLGAWRISHSNSVGDSFRERWFGNILAHARITEYHASRLGDPGVSLPGRIASFFFMVWHALGVALRALAFPVLLPFRLLGLRESVEQGPEFEATWRARHRRDNLCEELQQLQDVGLSGREPAQA